MMRREIVAACGEGNLKLSRVEIAQTQPFLRFRCCNSTFDLRWVQEAAKKGLARLCTDRLCQGCSYESFHPAFILRFFPHQCSPSIKLLPCHSHSRSTRTTKIPLDTLSGTKGTLTGFASIRNPTVRISNQLSATSQGTVSYRNHPRWRPSSCRGSILNCK